MGNRFITILIVLAVIFATGTAFAALQPVSAQQNSQSKGPTITDSAILDVGSLALTVTATGSIVAAQESKLSFQIPGVVKSILVQQGQTVKAGQTLAVVDDSAQQSAVQQAQQNLQAAQAALDKLLQPVDPNQIVLAQAAVKSAQGNLLAKNANLTQASITAYQAKVQQAQQDLSYATKLKNDAGGRYGTSDPNYSLALAQEGQAGYNLKIAQLNLQEAQKGTPTIAAQANIDYSKAKLAQVQAGPLQSDIDTAQAVVVAAQAQLDQAQHALAKTLLVAPYDGLITQATIQIGQDATTSYMVIDDLSKLFITINVDEGDITSVAVGQKVNFTFDALPGQTVNGNIDRITPAADVTASVVTYPVHVVLDKSAQGVRVGMTANATLTIRQLDNVLRIPNRFLKVTPATGQTTVTRVNPDGTVSIIPVKIGVAGADYTEIINGLNVGDKVGLVASTSARGQSN